MKCTRFIKISFPNYCKISNLSQMFRQPGAVGLQHFVPSLPMLPSFLGNSCQGPKADKYLNILRPSFSRLVYPVRTGEHSNTAFGLALALDYLRSLPQNFQDDGNVKTIHIHLICFPCISTKMITYLCKIQDNCCGKVNVR